MQRIIEQLKVPRLPQPVSNPKGWWLDSDPVPLFHGTGTINLPGIFKNGLALGSRRRCFVTPDPFTAEAYSFMGAGKASDKGGLHLINDMPSNYCFAVVRFDVPREFIFQYCSSQPGCDFNIRLLDRDRYNNRTESNSDFYCGSEVCFSVPLPPDFIQGYHIPNSNSKVPDIYRSKSISLIRVGERNRAGSH